MERRPKQQSSWEKIWAIALGLPLLLALFTASPARSAGLLKPLAGPDTGIRIRSHRVNVTLNNGFARTEVDQVFFNANDQDTEAVYTFPLPKQASLSELSLWIDGQEVVGEVLEKERARRAYESQRDQGNETALAEKDDYKTFNIHVGNVRAGSEARVRCVYYQPVEIDLNVGRYLYPLAEGNVDEERIAFWSVDDKVEGDFSFHLELKSAFPVKDVRLPGFEKEAVIDHELVSATGDVAEEASSSGEVYRVALEKPQGASLSRDIVFYYRLDDQVPARLELIPYREDASKPGTFMVVVTPAASLQPIGEGSDWVFVLDVSGSMQGHKIATLADGVERVLQKMNPSDRFRIVTFNSNARDFTGGYVQATRENAELFIQRVRGIQAGGSTALFAGLETAYAGLDDDRTTGLVLVTDGVANAGPTRHAEFLSLMKRHDLRLFTFVIGNSANQPLMDRLARDSGGFAMNLSDSDDIVGRLIQAKAKIHHQCLHDVELRFRGERAVHVTPSTLGNLYMGQQLVVFGRYDQPGEMEVELRGRVSGEERVWRCKALLPEKDTDNPELERLWALSAIDEVMEAIREKGETPDARNKVVKLGTEYSLVTDYTSMVVLREDVMESEGIQRSNARRVRKERQAQQTRAQAPVKSYRADDPSEEGGMFKGLRAPNIGTGPVGPLFAAAAVWLHRRKKRRS